MSGPVIALLSGIGFGLFQSLNRRAVAGMDIVTSTFTQLVVSTLVLTTIVAATEGLSVLLAVPPTALFHFALAAYLHFFVGWTLLNASLKQVGAARTSALISTTPLFGTLLAAAALRELPSAPALAGVGLVVGGIYMIIYGRIDPATRAVPSAVARGGGAPEWWVYLLGLGAALCWATSPIFTRKGLEHFPSPLVGVTAGLFACVAGYGLLVLLRYRGRFPAVERTTALFGLAAGALVGLATWGRWVALALSPIAVVLSLSQVSVPVVMLLSRVVAGGDLERVTARLWAGAAVIVLGTTVLLWVQPAVLPHAP